MKSRIEAQRHTALLASLNQVVPENSYDNDIINDVIRLTDRAALGSDKPMVIYRARMDGQPVAAAISAIAPDGYSGDIHIIVGVYASGEVAGVRVLLHKETPGLGDGIDVKKSDWILGFNGKSLNNPTLERWKVKKDAGDFDQLTGATITPRAIVSAVYKVLVFFQRNHAMLFEANTGDNMDTSVIGLKHSPTGETS